MATTLDLDTIQGVIPDNLWFHLDVSNDVLYLRKAETRNAIVFGEETREGFTLLRTDSGEYAGLTVVDYWKSYGHGNIDSTTFGLIRSQVGEWAKNTLIWFDE
ncbi:MAG: hypothetical protein ABJA67_06240 [Chthonomonadales bacterium]